MLRKTTYLLLLAVTVLTACKTPTNIAYFQDVKENTPIQVSGDGYIRFQSGDKLNILVHSRDEKLMELFNVTGRNNTVNMNANNGQNYAPYTIDAKGEIDFPVLGTVKVEGLTRDEVAKLIKEQLVSNNLCKDAVVTVAFYNMTFSVLGTVGSAGTLPINKDRITLLEAIAMANDLQIDGLRKNVLVMRQEGDKRVPYRVDLTSAESIYRSPVYYIQQNDLVYVEPNNKHKRSSTVMGSSAYQPTFWMSLASFLTTMALIFVKL